ncbi:A disintegrin and metalloproteinase with thrombospondin motifs 7 [Rhinophrynus dorsalis]
MWLLPLALLYLGLQDVAPEVSDLPLSFSLDSDIVHPVRVDEHGTFLTFDLSPRVIKKRGLSAPISPLTYYEIKYQGMELTFNLSQNKQLLAPGYMSEWRSGGIREARIRRQPPSSCHMRGEVQTQQHYLGNAAISICSGLRGVFKLAHEDFLIEPVVMNSPKLGEAMPHRIYRRHVAEARAQGQDGYRTCGVRETPLALEKWERRRESWEQLQSRQRSERRIRTRSISKEKWVETLVVADPKMVEYHGSDHVENYVLTVMNMVAGLFSDASIGNRINIVVVRLVLLESEEEDLKISHHADNTLRSFCKWQKNLNMKSEEHPLHHDVAVLLTRKDICAAMNRPCETLGLSHVSGMCQPHRSCNINEDTGLPTAFTVTHELGHSFGVQHDGSGNDCEPRGKRPHIMSPQLLYDTSPLTWSRCSRDYITRFLDRGWGLCLDDRPSKEILDFPTVPPGVLYDVSHQCRLQYGSSSSFCQDIDNVCNTLWCSVGPTCHSKLDAAVDGTSCGDNKWCFNGVCVPVGNHPSPVDGSWGSWSSWSSCTRSCGAGVQSAERHCSNPSPKNGGRYCLGERKRFRVCNVLYCPQDTPSFRHLQCSHFDSVPYKGKLHRWSPVSNSFNPCELHCQSELEYFAEKLLDSVIDGTPCYEGNTSRDLCINGICKNVGCDFEIDSNAVEDRCGVCHGDSSACHTVHKTFEDSDGRGYVDIGLIPPGAREIRIEEVAEAGNFLALRSEDPEKYFLNGMWIIQWNGDYRVAGTTFTYTRTGNLENLTAPGPTYEPVWIQLLFQERNPGVRYQYTIRRDPENSNEIHPPDFSWRYGSWTECSATCGTGVQRQMVHCVEKVAGLVEERYCDSLSRPDDRQRSCSEEPCPSRWWVGEWQPCTATCGPSGLQKRTVLCIQQVGMDEQRKLQQEECQHLQRPEASIPCNHHVPCPAVWHQGNWSQCSVSCGEGVQFREVNCINGTVQNICDPLERPISRRACVLSLCPADSVLSNFYLTGSGGSSREIFNDIFSGHARAPSSPQHPPEDNFISEIDFSNTGEGGQVKGGHAFVDDFYYDYNFINFHEDLNYDPLEENYITGGEKRESPGKELSTQVPPAEDLGERDKKPSKNSVAHTTENPHNYATTESFNKVTPTLGQASNIVSSSNPAETHNIVDEPYNGSTRPISEPLSGDRLAATDKKQKVLDQSHMDTDLTFQENSGLTTKEPVITHAPFSVSSQKPLLISLPESSVHQISPNPSVFLPEYQSPYIISQDEVKQTTQQPTSNIPINFKLDRSLDFAQSPSPNLKPYPFQNLAKYDSQYPILDILTDPVLDPSPNPTSDHSVDLAQDYSLFPVSDPSSNKEQDNMQAPTWDPKQNWNMYPLPGPTHYLPQDTIHDTSLNDAKIYPGQTENPLSIVLSAEDMLLDASKDMSPDISLSSPQDLSTSIKSKGDSSTDHTALPLRPPTPVDFLYTWSSIPKYRVWTDHNDMGVTVPQITTSVPAITMPPILEPQNKDPVASAMPNTLNNYVAKTFPSHPRTFITGEEKTTLPAPPNIIHKTLSIQTLGKKVSQNSHWDVGNWSECSTSCGLGAMWRPVRCKADGNETCDPDTKPAPARRCHLRPCASWMVGSWSKCSQSCGDGFKLRDVLCVDNRDKRVLRPFHCHSNIHKPRAQMHCNEQQCMEWYVSSWRECSEECGGGMQQRLVTCPQSGLCNESVKPNNTRSCNDHPCTMWAVGPWGQCTTTCGGGIQRRQVKCLNTRTGAAEEDNNLCDHEPWPENIQKCNTQDCMLSHTSVSCLRDRLTFSFCRTLRILGRCSLPTVQAQCCQTCQSHHDHRDLSNQRLS